MIEFRFEGRFEIEHRHLQISGGLDGGAIRGIRRLGELAGPHVGCRIEFRQFLLPTPVAVVMADNIDAQFDTGKLILAARRFLAAGGEHPFRILDILVAAFAEDRVLLTLPTGKLLFEFLDPFFQRRELIGGDRIELFDQSILLLNFVRQLFDPDQFAGEVGVVWDFLLAGADEPVDFALHRFESAQARLDFTEPGEFDFELAFQAVLTDERHAIIAARAGDVGAAFEQAVHQNGRLMTGEFSRAGNADHVSEQ